MIPTLLNKAKSSTIFMLKTGQFGVKVVSWGIEGLWNVN
jgi:hypothetical protein